MKYKSLFLAVATAIGMMAASVLKADHQYIEQHAEQLECRMDELREAFYEQFRDSGVYRELRSTAWDVRQGARQLERLARRGAAICDVREVIGNTDRSLSRLHALVGEARYRAQTGIDPPLCGCTLHVDAKIASARESLACLRGALLGNAGYVSTGGIAPVICYPPARAQNTGYFGPQAPVPGYNGSAPGWVPRPGSGNGVLPQGQYQENGPPLTGHGHGAGPALVNPGYYNQGGYSRTAGTGNQPVGLYGQRGNGIEMGNNGVVLKIGGAAIRLR